MLPNIRVFLVAYCMLLTSAVDLRAIVAAPDESSLWRCRHWMRTDDSSSIDLGCVDIFEKMSVFPNDPGAIVELGTGLSARYLARGDIRKAEASAIRTLELAESRLDRLDPQRTISMLRLGTVFLRQARYQESEWLLRKALVLGEASLRNNPQEYADLHENLALLELAHGRYDAAITILRRVRQIRVSQTPTTASMGATLFSLASALEQQGTFTDAISMYEQAATWFRAKYGSLSPQVALCILNSARSLQREGRLTEAEPIYQYALNILKDNPHTPPPDLARAYTELGFLYHAQGVQVLAQNLLQQGLTLREKSLGGSHPLVAESLIGLALGHLQRGEVPASIPLLWRAIAILESGLRLPLSEARTTSLLEQQRNIGNFIIAGLLRFPASTELKQLAMAATLLRKGRSEDAGRRTSQATLATAMTKAQAARLADWKASRAEYEQLILQGPGLLSPEDYRVRFHSLRLKIEDLEHALLADTGQLDARSIPEPKDIVSRVASQLDQSSHLLEVVLTRPFLTNQHVASDATRYVALVLDASSKIDAYDLGDATTIDQQISALLARLQDRAKDPQPAAQAVYQLLFSPMKESLPSTGRIYVSADSSLHLIPFAALHDGNNYLIERYQFSYLSSGRDLLESNHRAASGPPVVVADPEFAAAIQPNGDSPASTSPDTQEDVTADRGTAGLYSMITGAARLPGTRREARLLSGLWPDAKLLLGRDAEETQVRRIVAPLFLHLATHGVLLEDQPNTATGTGGQSARALIPLAASGISGPAGSAEGVASKPLSLAGGDRASALSRSALLLAGVESAHRSRDRYHDGLLTADEVREMNLWGTKLVVLSACDSGRGAIRAGQGVYGLRRAFFTAGAETLVTSLWRVADAETSELMGEFYQRLSKGGRRIGSLSDAMLAVRKRHPHPYYWAPFIGIGRDAPLSESSADSQAIMQEMPKRTEPAKQSSNDASSAGQERQTTEGDSVPTHNRTTNLQWGSNAQGLANSPNLPARVQVFLVGPAGIILEPAGRRYDTAERIDELTDDKPPGCLPPCGRWYPREYQFRIRSASWPEIDWFSLTNPHRQVTIHYTVASGNFARRKLGAVLLGVGAGALPLGLALMGGGRLSRDPNGKPFAAGCGLSIIGATLTISGGTLFGVNRTTVSVRQTSGSPQEQ